MGLDDGLRVGTADGKRVEGAGVGMFVARPVGVADIDAGLVVGEPEGDVVGLGLGDTDGSAEGINDGTFDGDEV